MRNKICLFLSIGLIIFPSIFLSGQEDSLIKKGGTPVKEVTALSDSLETLMKDFFSIEKNNRSEQS